MKRSRLLAGFFALAAVSAIAFSYWERQRRQPEPKTYAEFLEYCNARLVTKLHLVNPALDEVGDQSTVVFFTSTTKDVAELDMLNMRSTDRSNWAGTIQVRKAKPGSLLREQSERVGRFVVEGDPEILGAIMGQDR